MGLNICFVKGFEDHPEWDNLRQGSDRAFPNIIDWEKVESLDGFAECFRPTNIDELRTKVNETDWPSKERYLHLLQLIEENPDYWLLLA